MIKSNVILEKLELLTNNLETLKIKNESQFKIT